MGAGGDVLSYNLFAYCSNNPVNMFDPSGTVGVYVFAGGYDLITGLPVFMETSPDLDISNSYKYKQYDYSKFINSKGKNVGCSATSLATCRSYLENSKITPDTMDWNNNNGYLNSWGKNTTVYYEISADKIYKLILAELRKGKPTILFVRTKNGGGHYVTVSGATPNAFDKIDINSIKIIDPAYGAEKPLNIYTIPADSVLVVFN